MAVLVANIITMFETYQNSLRMIILLCWKTRQKITDNGEYMTPSYNCERQHITVCNHASLRADLGLKFSVTFYLLFYHIIIL